MFRILPSLFSTVQRFAPAAFPTSSFHSITATTVALPNVSTPWSFTSIRNKIRCYFPRPSENKRIKRHGWKTRMSTPTGRRVLMRRILKGRHTLSH